MVVLTNPERQTLSQLCETLVPDGSSGGSRQLSDLSAADLDLAERLESALLSVSSPAELAQMRQFLRVIQIPPLNWLLSGRWSSFGEMTLAEREHLLLTWATSRIGLRRMAFQGLKRLALFIFYAALTSERPSESEAIFRYRSPEQRPPAPPSQIEPVELDQDAEIECDVVVVGSGAGGAVTAAFLAQRGLAVLVLEKGGFFAPADYHGHELQANQDLFENSGAVTTRDLGLVVLAGSALGGGTIVNWSTSLPTPLEVRRQWANEFGFQGVDGDEYEKSLQAVQERMHVDRDESPAGAHNGVLARGAQAIGVEAGAIPRNVKACQTCDFCAFGCVYGAKQDSLQTYLTDAYRAGAQLVVRAFARKVLIEDGRARGVLAEVNHQGRAHQLTVRSRAVVAAAGSIHTPLLLTRSGLTNRHIGGNLRLHPVTASFARYDEPVASWQGPPQTRLVEEWADLDGNGYGVRLEVAPAHPGLWASALPWTSGWQHKELMDSLHHLANIIVITRDRGSGRVLTGSGQRPVLSYRMSPYDSQHMLHGLLESIRIHAAAGARQIFSPHTVPLVWERGQDLNAYLGRVERIGLGPNQSSAFSAHQLGSCRVAAEPSLGALGPDGQAHEVENLFVTDGSVFPTACGVNPMIPISATAHFLSEGIFRKLD